MVACCARGTPTLQACNVLIVSQNPVGCIEPHLELIMRYVLLMLLAGCGNLQPDTPDSKLNANPNANPQTTNAAPNNDPLNVVTVDPSSWGTSGPATMSGKSAQGHALCTLDDVTTSDLPGSNVDEVQPDPWASAPVPDGAARCGDDVETLVWRLHNCERIGTGRQPFACDQRLVWSGREHTLDMIRQDYFRHDNPAGESPFDRLNRHGVGWSAAAENIVPGATALAMHYAWMDSQGHRANILGAFSHAGIGAEVDGDGLLATAVFINPN